jgi:Asp-tRNA(Asn)/Glu-tRNA(Gln) amidotransferase A subunit family amidase
MFREYDSYDGLALAELIKTQQISSADIIDEMRNRIDALNPELNAVVQLFEDELKKTPVSDAVFSGLPMLLKDLNIYCQGQFTRNGSRLPKGVPAAQDSELVKRYRKAGLIIAGQTNSPEFGLSPSTEPKLNGPTHNPWKKGISPGGSSGGAAAAIAAGIVPFANASDGGGSIRIPASACGLFGLKPSRGRISQAPYLGEGWNGFSTHHAITRSVRDSAALLDISQGYVAGDPYTAPQPAGSYLAECQQQPKPLKIAFNTLNPMGLPVDPDCIAAVQHAAALCESLGHNVEEAAPEFDAVELSISLYGIIGPHILATVRELEQQLGRSANDDELEELTRLMMATASEQSAEDYVKMQRSMHKITRQLAPFWQSYDLYLTPVIGMPPQAHGSLLYKSGDDYESYGITMATYSPFAGMANLTGQPSMSVPLYWNDKQLPIGVMFTVAYSDEATLFRLAAQLERQQPWFDRRP